MHNCVHYSKRSPKSNNVLYQIIDLKNRHVSFSRTTTNCCWCIIIHCSNEQTVSVMKRYCRLQQTNWLCSWNREQMLCLSLGSYCYRTILPHRVFLFRNSPKEHDKILFFAISHTSCIYHAFTDVSNLSPTVCLHMNWINGQYIQMYHLFPSVTLFQLIFFLF